MGRSVVDRPADSARRHADDLAAVLDEIGVASAVVVGHAGGATSALTFAAAHPERTRGVVLIDSTPVARPRLDDPTDGFGSLLASMIAELDGPGGEAALRRFYTGYFGPECDPAISTAAIDDALRTPLAVASAELRWAVGDADAVALAEQTAAPVLWLTATLPDGAQLHAAFRDVTIGVVAGSGHFPQLEVPAQVNAMIATFLAQSVR
jgi:pimeloyl-ACP methyl ester carboxylesterase